MQRIIQNTIFLILSGCHILTAQPLLNINGFVRDNATGEPISYANVFLSNTSIGAATNSDGYFVMSDIPIGKYEINISMMGYAVYKEEVDLSQGQSIRLNIRLKEEAIQGTEVLVTAERQKFERSMESSQIALDLREINSAPAFVEPDVFKDTPNVAWCSNYK